MKAIIIRHAEREKMPSELGKTDINFDESQVPITENGKNACLKIGHALYAATNFIWHSPILRCQQTAEYLNFSKKLTNQGPSNFLMSEFFGDLNAMDEKQKKFTMEELLIGKDTLNIDLDKKMKQIYDWFENNSKNDSGIYVTHDWWIALFLSYFTNIFKQQSFDIWPEFLEYFEIDFYNKSIVYRNKSLELIKRK